MAKTWYPANLSFEVHEAFTPKTASLSFWPTTAVAAEPKTRRDHLADVSLDCWDGPIRRKPNNEMLLTDCT